MFSEKTKTANDIAKEIELAKKTSDQPSNVELSRVKAMQDQKEKINELLGKVKDKLDAIEMKIQDFSKSVVMIGNKEQK